MANKKPAQPPPRKGDQRKPPVVSASEVVQRGRQEKSKSAPDKSTPIEDAAKEAESALSEDVEDTEDDEDDEEVSPTVSDVKPVVEKPTTEDVGPLLDPQENASMTTAESNASTEVTQLETDETALGDLRLVELSRIDPKSFPNQRTGNFTEGDSSENGQGNSFMELVESIKLSGQKDPITVRPKLRSKGNKSVAEFEVVKGFRRFAAISFIAQENEKNRKPGETLQPPTIAVIVKNLSDLEALEENIFENTARDNLSGPDLAWAAYNLKQAYRFKGVEISDNKLAARMGKNQSYISKLMRIIDKAPVVAKKWREAATTNGLTVDALERIATKIPTPELQEVEYNRILKGLETPGKRGAAGKPPLDIAKRRAEIVAELLGRLQRIEVVAVRPDLDWTAVLGAFGVNTESISGIEQVEVAKAAITAYQKALTPPPIAEVSGKPSLPEASASMEQ